MAKRFRLDSLSQESRGKLNQFISQYIPEGFKEDALDSIEKTGTISPGVFQKINASSESQRVILEQLNPIVSGIPSLRDALTQHIASQKDEATLTDQELQDRLQAFQNLPGTARTDRVYDVEGLRNKIAEVINRRVGQGRGNDPTVRDSILNRFLADPNFDTNNPEIRQAYRASIDEIKKSLGNYLLEKIDTSADVSRVQDLIDARARTGLEDVAVSDFLKNTPQTLADITGKQIAGERSRGIQTLNDILIPEIRQSLNVRGLLDSGDLSSEVARAAGDVLSPIEEQEMALREADLNFFMDAAYQDTLRKAIHGNEDLSGFITAQQGLARSASENRFQVGQSDIRNQASLALFTRQQDRALASARLRAQRDLETSNRNIKNQLIGSSAQLAGQIGGTAIVSKSMKNANTANDFSLTK